MKLQPTAEEIEKSIKISVYNGNNGTIYETTAIKLPDGNYRQIDSDMVWPAWKVTEEK